MKFIPNAITAKYARQVLLCRKQSPKILFGVGVVGAIGSTVLACRATLRLEETLSLARNDLDIAYALDHENYSEGDRKRDVTVIYVRSAVVVGKLYAPSVLLGVASISALTASHNILSQRNVALTAAYAALDRGFTEYRERVIEKFGEEEDQKLRYDSEEVTIDSNGKKAKVIRAAPGASSIYARFFDEYSKSWSKEPEYNLLFIKCQQNYANDLLKARGHVFLNEVYDMLGIERSQAGQIVGWVMSRENDNFIDFGVFDGNENTRDFVNGRERSILLDFNVDGVVWDKIDEYKKGEVAWQS